MGVSFWKPQRRSATELLSRPLGLFAMSGQAGRSTFSAKTVLWCSPVLNFRAKLPFHAMKHTFCGLLKEIPMARSCLGCTNGFFKALKCYKKLSISSQFVLGHSNELPRRKQRGIIKSIERPKGRGIKPLLDLKYNWLTPILETLSLTQDCLNIELNSKKSGRHKSLANRSSGYI